MNLFLPELLTDLSLMEVVACWDGSNTLNTPASQLIRQICDSTPKTLLFTSSSLEIPSLFLSFCIKTALGLIRTCGILLFGNLNWYTDGKRITADVSSVSTSSLLWRRANARNVRCTSIPPVFRIALWTAIDKVDQIQCFLSANDRRLTLLLYGLVFHGTLH